MLIFLIGARGSGKTTVGRALSESLNCPFIDLDQEVLEDLGETIEAFVAKNGWQAFRERESARLERTCGENRGKSLVIATGGGVPLAGKNRDLLRKHGRVVWLDAPAETMAARLSANPLQSQRPSLTGRPPWEETAAICKEREPIYRSCCHVRVNGNQQPEAVCAEIMATLKE